MYLFMRLLSSAGNNAEIFAEVVSATVCQSFPIEIFILDEGKANLWRVSREKWPQEQQVTLSASGERTAGWVLE